MHVDFALRRELPVRLVHHLLHGHTGHSRELVVRRQQGTIGINDQEARSSGFVQIPPTQRNPTAWIVSCSISYCSMRLRKVSNSRSCSGEAWRISLPMKTKR